MAAAGGHAVSDGCNGDEVGKAELGLRVNAVGNGRSVQTHELFLAYTEILIIVKCTVAGGLTTQSLRCDGSAFRRGGFAMLTMNESRCAVASVQGFAHGTTVREVGYGRVECWGVELGQS